MRSLLTWLSVAVVAAAAGAWAQDCPEELGRVEAASSAVADVAAEGPSLTLRGWAPTQEAPGDADGVESPDSDADADVEIEALVTESCPPEDPLETGTSTLAVRVTDEAGAVPEALRLELWRLGAPANQDWLSGDKRQADAWVSGGRIEWSELPEGRYRLFSPDLRPETDDPLAFEVAGALTRVSVALPLPRSVPVLVRVVDETGAPLFAGRRTRFGGSSDGIEVAPAWRIERRFRHGVVDSPMVILRGCESGYDAPAPCEATAGSFELGACDESTREGSTSWSSELSFEGRTDVSAHVESTDVRAPHPTRYVAVSVPLEHVTACVWTSEGRLAVEAGARFDARCWAVRVAEGHEGPAPGDLPIHVRVTLAGHQPLKFTTKPGERPVERTLLRAAEPELPAR